MNKKKITGFVLAAAMLTLGVNAGYAENTAVVTTAVVEPVLSGTAVELPAEGGSVVFDTATGTVTGFTGSVKSVNIPASISGAEVKAIGKEAFKNCLTLESVSMASSITSIGEFAFDHCTKLRSIVLPKNITTIPKGVFNWCTALSSVTIPSSTVTIDNEAFSGCSKSKITLKVIKDSAADKFAAANGYKTAYVTEDIWTTTTEATTVEASTVTVTEAVTETTTKRGSRGGKIRGIRGYIPATKENSEETTDENYDNDENDSEDTISGDVRVTVGSSVITVGDEEFLTDAAPYIQPESSSMLVPLRFAATAIRGENPENAMESDIVKWNAVTKTATIHTGKNTVSFTAGSSEMLLGSKPVLMENGVRAEITAGRMYIPFRVLGNALGVNVYWDAENKTALYSRR